MGIFSRITGFLLILYLRPSFVHNRTLLYRSYTHKHTHTHTHTHKHTQGLMLSATFFVSAILVNNGSLTKGGAVGIIQVLQHSVRMAVVNNRQWQVSKNDSSKYGHYSGPPVMYVDILIY